MCDPVSLSNQMVQQTNNQLMIQNHIDTHNRFVQQQQDLVNQQLLLNNVIRPKPRINPLALISDNVKTAFVKKVNPEKDTVDFSNAPKEKRIPGINCPGIHRGPDGVIDGMIGGRTDDGGFIFVDLVDPHIGGMKPDGTLWDGVRVGPKPGKRIPGINCPGIHRDPDGKIDGIIGGRTDDGGFIFADPVDPRTGGMKPDGTLWDGVKLN
ncbi:MAG: hypothetical protein K6E29_00220 [Cyanobacteria bacterium RUI128]|nr:hypothetical protein [Cyanobacteria bacterium RUI128]